MQKPLCAFHTFTVVSEEAEITVESRLDGGECDGRMVVIRVVRMM